MRGTSLSPIQHPGLNSSDVSDVPGSAPDAMEGTETAQHGACLGCFWVNRLSAVDQGGQS